MPTLSVGDDIVFHYTDSGPIEKIEYSTLVLVHGHTFQTGRYNNTHHSGSEYHTHDPQVYSSESYLSLALIHYVSSVLAAANTKDPLPTPQMS